MSKLWSYKFFSEYKEDSISELENQKFFDTVYLKALEDIYLCEVNNTFNIPSAFTRLFTQFEDLYAVIIGNLYEGELKHFYKDRELHFTISLNYYPKTSLKSPILELELSHYSYLNKVFEDNPTKFLKLLLKDYVR